MRVDVLLARGPARFDGRWSSAALVAALAVAVPVRAEVKEPDGTTVPRDSGKEIQLSALFSQQGEQIDFIQDGFPTPDTFSPLCNFKATMMLRQSGSDFGVGWYNVVPNATAAPSAIYPIFPTSNNDVGATITGSDIRSDPNYAGGLIGFALMRDPPSYSEAKWNTVCSLCLTAGPWILSVSYRSTKLPNAYYVAFEDGDTSFYGWSNDGDFNDYVMLFEGLACAGDGEACTIDSAKGVCRDGIQECANTGTLTCKALNAPRAEKCDALDNDCDGQVDNGDKLCDKGLVCSHGQCVPTCGSSEFDCLAAPFTECSNGLCIDPQCKGKTCDAGQICLGGTCRAACDGVKCPVGQACRFGACVDPCEGVSCGPQRVCVGGACVVDCTCGGCAKGSSCDADHTRLCVADSCSGKTCGTGQYCANDGSCQDACADASCPAGEICMAGACILNPVKADAGLSSTGSSPGAGAGSPSYDGGTSGVPAVDGGAIPTPYDASYSAPVGGLKSNANCGCHVESTTRAPSRAQWAISLLLMCSLLVRRRKR